MRQIHGLQLSLDGCPSTCLLRLPVPENLARFQVVDREAGGFSIAARNFVDDPDCFFIVALSHVVFGRFVDREEPESNQEHDERQSSDCE